MSRGDKHASLKPLGATIRCRRLSKGFSQEKLSELAQCNRNYIGMVERGQHNLTYSVLKRICTALDTTLESLSRSAGI